ncbi:hypothetical protein EJB05_15137, partial [Eragrostis curvula]
DSFELPRQDSSWDVDAIEGLISELTNLLNKLQNLSNRQKPGCGKGSAVDRSREQTAGQTYSLCHCHSSAKEVKERMDDFQ